MFGRQYGDGYAASTAGPGGRNYVTATAGADGGPPARIRVCSTRRRAAPHATDTGDQALPLPGPKPPYDEHATTHHRDLWSARCLERGTPGAGSGPGRRTSHMAGNRVPGRLHRPPLTTMIDYID